MDSNLNNAIHLFNHHGRTTSPIRIPDYTSPSVQKTKTQQPDNTKSCSIKSTIKTGLRCRYNHSERKNHTKFFAEPPPHWSTTISHRLTPSLHPLLQTNHPFLFVFHLPLSTESHPLHL